MVAAHGDVPLHPDRDAVTKHRRPLLYRPRRGIPAQRGGRTTGRGAHANASCRSAAKIGPCAARAGGNNNDFDLGDVLAIRDGYAPK